MDLRTIPRPIRRVSAHLAVLLCLLGLVLSACGASARTKALRTSLVALNAARDTTLAVSKEREKQIYAGCKPPACAKEEGYARVKSWQKKVDAVIEALDFAYDRVHDAGLLGDTKSAADAAAASKKALNLYEKLTKEGP